MTIANIPGQPDVQPGMEQRSDVALRQILLAELAIIERNEACLLQQCDVECLHDFRVAVRRSKIVLARLPDVFPAREVQRFTRQFSYLSDITGPCRDLDVLLQHWPEYVTTTDVAYQKVYDFLLQLGAKARADLMAGLTDDHYVDFKTRWRKFLLKPPAATRMQNATLPMAVLVTPIIKNVLKKLVKRLRSIKLSSSDSKLHKVRIMSKRLRYLLDYFRQDHADSASMKLISELKVLQDVLGVNQDLCMQKSMIKTIGKEMKAAGLMQDNVADALNNIKKIIKKYSGKQRKVVLKSIKLFLKSDALAEERAALS